MHAAVAPIIVVNNKVNAFCTCIFFKQNEKPFSFSNQTDDMSLQLETTEFWGRFENPSPWGQMFVYRVQTTCVFGQNLPS